MSHESKLSLGAAPAATAEQWQQAVAAVLVKSKRMAESDDPADAPAKLAKRTTDGIEIAPLAGTDVARDLASTPTGADAVRGRLQTQAPEPGDVPTWDLRVFISDRSQQPTDALEGGAGSLWLSSRALGGVGAVLDGVLLDVAPVVLDSADPVTDGTDLINAANGTLHPHSNLGLDPTGELLLTGTAADDQLAEVAALARDNSIRGFVVDTSIVHDAGAGEVLELAYAAAAGIHLLRQLDEVGIDAAEAARLIEFRYAATDQQFTTIAKLRAARAIWSRICQVLGIDDDVQAQHAVTSGRMMTQFDPWTNLLRTTIATFAAGVGGADAITVQEYDAALGTSDDFGRRMARNISNLLVNESHIAQVHDPAGGAGSIERLTDDLARAGWAKFTEIERDGGIRAFIADGSLARELDAAIARRAGAIAKREQPITGVSEFPLADEQLLVREPGYSRYAEGALIRPVRDADGFEQLRREPASRPVFLWPIGPLAAHTARATFAANLLTAGGIPVVQGKAGADFDTLAAAAREAKTTVICLVGSDEGYRTEGPALVEQLRGAGPAHLINAGKPVSELADSVDDFMAVGQDALAFLNRTRTALEEQA